MLFLLTDNGVSITIFKIINTFKKCLTSLILISSRQILVVIAHNIKSFLGTHNNFNSEIKKCGKSWSAKLIASFLGTGNDRSRHHPN